MISLMSVDQAAAACGLSRRTLYRERERGGGPVRTHVSGPTFVAFSDLMAFPGVVP